MRMRFLDLRNTHRPAFTLMKNSELLQRGWSPDYKRTPRGPDPRFGRATDRKAPQKDDTPCCSEFPDCSCSELLK